MMNSVSFMEAPVPGNAHIILGGFRCSAAVSESCVLGKLEKEGEKLLV
jgi:hypothetical protein